MPYSAYSNGVEFSWIGCQLTYVAQNQQPAWITVFSSNHVAKALLEVPRASLGHVCVDAFKVYPGEKAVWDGVSWNLSYSEDLEYDFSPPADTVRIPKCTCGAAVAHYFDAGHSDWCDLIRRD